CSAYFDCILRSSPDRSYVDLETRSEVRFPHDLGLVDLGDIEIFPTDLARTGASIAAFTRAAIDIVACPYAPGTGGIVLDGLEARQLFEAVSVFARSRRSTSPRWRPTTIRPRRHALFHFRVERDAAARD